MSNTENAPTWPPPPAKRKPSRAQLAAQRDPAPWSRPIAADTYTTAMLGENGRHDSRCICPDCCPDCGVVGAHDCDVNGGAR